jgi:shikimate dehydrogenase
MTVEDCQICAALVGRGIGGSKTPAMHEAEGRAQGLNYCYDLVDVNTSRFRHSSLQQLIEMVEEEGYRGANITHPFKADILSLLDEHSDDVKAVGAANTVIFQNGKRIGYNTDYSGFKAAFSHEMVDVNRSDVLVLGAGGAGAAVALALIDSGVERLVIFDTSHDQAGKLMDRLYRARAGASVSIALEVEAVDWRQLNGVVNATPMGMDEYPGMAIDPSRLSSAIWVADIVYFPLETKLLSHAKKRNCRTMSGAGMAIHQAALSFGLITGRSADVSRFYKSFKRMQTKNQFPKR